MPNNEDKKDRGFTNTEVVTLFESLKLSIEVVAEGVTSLQDDVHILKEDVSDIKVRLRTVEDAVKIAIPDLNKRVTQLELKAAS